MTQENQRQGLMLLSRCLQKPGDWLTDRIVSGLLNDAISSLFPTDPLIRTEASLDPLTEFQHLLASYQQSDPETLRKDLTRQYARWTTVNSDTAMVSGIVSPFKETQDPLHSYRHLPGQEIMEWYHCCGMKMPHRFIGRPDSIHMKLEFAIYLIGNSSKHPEDPDHKNTYHVFLQRFFLPHIERVLVHRCGRDQFPFYYKLCALIHAYLT